MLNMSQFVERLKELMFDEDVDVAKLSKAIGTGKSTIFTYFAGNLPDVRIAVKLADYFNCTLDYLLARENENHSTTFYPCPPFSERFVWLCKEHFKVTYEELHDKIGFALSAMYYWRKGTVVPNLDAIIRLADYFNCTVDFIIGRTSG